MKKLLVLALFLPMVAAAQPSPESATKAIERLSAAAQAGHLSRMVIFHVPNTALRNASVDENTLSRIYDSKISLPSNVFRDRELSKMLSLLTIQGSDRSSLDFRTGVMITGVDGARWTFYIEGNATYGKLNGVPVRFSAALGEWLHGYIGDALW